MKRALLTATVVIWLVIVTAVISHGGFWKMGNPASAAAALAGFVNASRASAGLGTLTENTLLDQAAQLKAEDMATKGYYSHTSPEGYAPFHWLDAVRYKYLNVGENLDVQYVGSDTNTDAEVHEAFMNSPEHRDNILLPQFTEIGVGVAEGTYKGQAATFFVELFATPYPLAAYVPQPVVSVSSVLPVHEPVVVQTTATLLEQPQPAVPTTVVSQPLPAYTATAFADAVRAFLISLSTLAVRGTL